MVLEISTLKHSDNTQEVAHDIKGAKNLYERLLVNCGPENY